MNNDKNKSSISNKKAFIMTRRAVGMWFKQYPQIFISSGIYSIFSALTPLAGIYFVARIVDELGGQRNQQVLIRLVVLTLSVTGIMMLIKFAAERWRNSSTDCIIYKESKFFSDKLLTMDFCSVDDAHSYDLMSQSEQNKRWGGWGMINVINYCEQFFKSIISVIGSISLTVTLFTLNVPNTAGKLTILNSPLCIIGIILIMGVVNFLSPYLAIKSGEYWSKNAHLATMGNRVFSFYGFLGFNFKRALDIRMFNQEKLCRKYLKGESAFGLKGAFAKFSKGPAGLLMAISTAVAYVFTLVIYIFVCLKAWGGAFGPGSVTQYIGAITTLAAGVSEIIYTLGEMKNNCEFLKPVFEFMDIPNNMYQGSLTVEKRNDRNYQIEFKNVSFKYPGTDEWALRNVSMKFNIGERLAVVGRNGSGKTTFIKLLCRLYDPNEGIITLNGIDIRKYNYLEYMSIFSIVFQDFKLFAFPLGENIAASSEYDKERIEKCLEEAGFDKRLKSMPFGIDTYLYKHFNKNGVDVSGGEAQKIAIARCLYKDAPFIILDEPTAALDPIAEYEIYTKFNDIINDKTAIYISHRLSSCRFCDEVAVFDNGCMIQQGTHDELLEEKDGKYYELWNAQAQYYTEEKTDASL